jgi:hypothetical protein
VGGQGVHAGLYILGQGVDGGHLRAALLAVGHQFASGGAPFAGELMLASGQSRALVIEFVFVLCDLLRALHRGLVLLLKLGLAHPGIGHGGGQAFGLVAVGVEQGRLFGDGLFDGGDFALGFIALCHHRGVVVAGLLQSLLLVLDVCVEVGLAVLQDVEVFAGAGEILADFV